MINSLKKTNITDVIFDPKDYKRTSNLRKCFVTARLKYTLVIFVPFSYSHSSLKTAIQKLMDQNHLYGTNL